jgi:hypothetical protein
MALIRVSNRDKKLIIWNFMEELSENYRNAMENKLDTRFRFMDFYNIGLLSQYLRETGVDGLPDEILADTLKEYAKESDYIKIKGNMVNLTKNGLEDLNTYGTSSHEFKH